MSIRLLKYFSGIFSKQCNVEYYCDISYAWLNKFDKAYIVYILHLSQCYQFYQNTYFTPCAKTDVLNI